MLKTYEELSDHQKEQAREMLPENYSEYLYQTIGVNIEFAAK